MTDEMHYYLQTYHLSYPSSSSIWSLLKAKWEQMQFLRKVEKGAKCRTFCLNHFLETLSVGVSIVMNHFIPKLETKQIKKPEKTLVLREQTVHQNFSHLSTKKRQKKKMELQRIWNCKIMIREQRVKQTLTDIWTGVAFLLTKIPAFNQSPLWVVMKAFHTSSSIVSSKKTKDDGLFLGLVWVTFWVWGAGFLTRRWHQGCSEATVVTQGQVWAHPSRAVESGSGFQPELSWSMVNLSNTNII